MKIAVYARKSKLTEKGDSMQNQVEMCKNYARLHFSASDSAIVAYEDEGYSGGNTDRPMYKRLMNDIAKKQFDILMCYRLDRISRNVLDFSHILDALDGAGMSFVSITEHFDTTTPMGRAMLTIAAVFAQLERETIAERIRDNMRRLARTGRYLGSTPPFGFISARIDYIDPNGHKKKMHQLQPVQEDLLFVHTVFEKYLEFESLAKIETWMMQVHYKNRNGNYTGVTELKRILTNPVYVKANETIHDYYQALGADIVNPRSDFNGIRGMLLYGRHERNNNQKDPKKWTVVLAKHEGVIEPDAYLAVQGLLERNRTKAARAGTGKIALLTSKIKCAHCGGTMVVIFGADKSRHYYKCRTKIKSRKALCDIRNINGHAIDTEIYEHVKSLSMDRDRISGTLRAYSQKEFAGQGSLASQARRLRMGIQEKEAEIKNLTVQLRAHHTTAAAKHIIREIENIESELAAMKESAAKIDDQITEKELRNNENEIEKKAVPVGFLLFSGASVVETLEVKRKFINKIIDAIIWDGDDFNILFR